MTSPSGSSWPARAGSTGPGRSSSGGPRDCPIDSTLPTDDFLALTLDLWSIPAESARRVGHPAPFPVELPEQLIRLYTFADDLVLDPFMGSGSALVAAARLGRRYVGYDLDPAYVELARRRVAEVDELVADTPFAEDDGRAAVDLAEDALVAGGFTIRRRRARVPKAGLAVSFAATDAAGRDWLFDVGGAHTSHRGGLARTDAVWRALGRASAVRGRADPDVPFVLLTTELPDRRSDGDRALRAAGSGVVFDVIDVRSAEGRARLARYAWDGPSGGPQLGFWTAKDLGRGEEGRGSSGRRT